MNADAQNQELMRLYRIKKTVLKMLSKRGYNVLDQTLEATFQTFAVSCLGCFGLDGWLVKFMYAVTPDGG